MTTAAGRAEGRAHSDQARVYKVFNLQGAECLGQRQSAIDEDLFRRQVGCQNDPTGDHRVCHGLVPVLRAREGTVDRQESCLPRGSTWTTTQSFARRWSRGAAVTPFRKFLSAIRTLADAMIFSHSRAARAGSINSGGLLMNEVRTEGVEANVGGVQVTLQSVYLKDCSYESPNGPRLPNNQGWEPKFQLNMNTSAEELAADVSGSTTDHHPRSQAGPRPRSIWWKSSNRRVLHRRCVGGRPEAPHRQLLPSVLFPYAREVISDLIVKGVSPIFSCRWSISTLCSPKRRKRRSPGWSTRL